MRDPKQNPLPFDTFTKGEMRIEVRGQVGKSVICRTWKAGNCIGDRLMPMRKWEQWVTDATLVFAADQQ